MKLLQDRARYIPADESEGGNMQSTSFRIFTIWFQLNRHNAFNLNLHVKLFSFLILTIEAKYFNSNVKLLREQDSLNNLDSSEII